MDRVAELLEELKTIARNPKESVEIALRDTGRKGVGCFPIYAPEELIYAAGAIPFGMWGGPIKGNLSDRYLQTFCCSVMKANTEQALLKQYDILSAVLMTTFCDTLKCVMENWKVASPQLNIIPIVYPQNRKTPSGIQFFQEELTRVKKELEEKLNCRISESDIQRSIDFYDEYREKMNQYMEVVRGYPNTIDAVTRHLIIKASYFMDKKNYIQKMDELISELRKRQIETTGREKRIILSGLMAEPEELLRIFDENGFHVIGDDLAQESRQFREEGPSEGTWQSRMAKRIAQQDGCAFLYDAEKTRGHLLIQMKERYQADAIVLIQMKFCDPEEFDYPILKKELGEANTPLLYLEIEQQMDSPEQIRTRIQSFAEMLA